MKKCLCNFASEKACAHVRAVKICNVQIKSAEAAQNCPWTMVNDAGEYFYPDGPEDAAEFMEGHGAHYVNPDFTWEAP